MKTQNLLNMSPILLDRARLTIMLACAAQEQTDFNSLLATTELTRGNLSSHIKKLEEASLLEVTKEFVERKPRTTYKVTKLGRSELKAHLQKIESALRQLF